MMQILIVVPVALKELAEQAVSQIDPVSIGRTFTIELGAVEGGPVTHVACQPNVTHRAWEQVALMAGMPVFAGARIFAAESDADHLAMIARSFSSLGLVAVH